MEKRHLFIGDRDANLETQNTWPSRTITVRGQRIWPPTGRLCALLSLAVVGLLYHHHIRSFVQNTAAFDSAPPSVLHAANLENCAWSHLEPQQDLLSVAPIDRAEFLSRQGALARELDVAGIDAFVAEPSASTTYYANISSEFELSERPFLMIIGRDGRFWTLVPMFEVGRIAKLDMVSDNKTTITWVEEESPYDALARGTGYKTIMLDEHARFMIAAGLKGAGIEVVPMSETVQSLRSVKTAAEIALLKGINAFTLALIQSLQKCVQVGLTQEAVERAAHALFERAGVGRGFWAIILFGHQAALPHGGESGKTLDHGEFLLIDIGSELHGYGSDVTRTILPSGANVSSDLMDIWHTVKEAQSAGFAHMQAGEVCSSVDNASREVIKRAGYGQFYTHRLGHGLGLEMHEPPYLNGANGEKLKLGEVVTNEPGIYVTAEQASLIGKDAGFGVRLEDPIWVTEDGGVPLTGSRAKSPWEP